MSEQRAKKKGEIFKKEQERERKGACRIDRKVDRREGEGSEGGWCFSLKSLPAQRGNILSTGICHHCWTQLKPI